MGNKKRKVFAVFVAMTMVFSLFLGMPLTSASASGELTVSYSYTPEQLVAMLLGSDVEVRDVRYTGAAGALGFVQGDISILGIAEGIVLSTGDLGVLIGPNNLTSYSVSNGTAGDADLNKLVNGADTYDAAVLEFYFKVDSDNIYFQYVFGSEEYNEYVDSGYNDVFGFFLDGVNIALIPGTNTPVSINNVNNGYASGANKGPGPGKNSDYFIDNYDGHLNTQLDGLTTVLLATASVTPGEWHHIKLAIADVADTGWDSAVVISAGTFSGINPASGNVWVENQYYINGVRQDSGEVRGLWFTANEGETPITNSFFRQNTYNNVSYAVKSADLIVTAKLAEYSIEFWEVDSGVRSGFLMGDLVVFVGDELAFDEEFIIECFNDFVKELCDDSEEYDADDFIYSYYDPESLILTADPDDNVFRVFYDIGAAFFEVPDLTTETTEDMTTEEPEGPVTGLLTADKFYSKSIEPEIISLYDNGSFLIDEYEFFMDEYDYEIIVYYNNIPSSGPTTYYGGDDSYTERTTRAVAPVVPVVIVPEDVPLAEIPTVVIEAQDTPLADIPQTGVPFELMGFVLLLLASGTILFVRKFKREEQ